MAVRFDLTAEPKTRPPLAERASVFWTATPEQAGPTDAAHPLLRLQHLRGNRYVQQIIGHTRQAAHPCAAPVLQTKLLLGPADDCHEREADHVAQQAMGRTLQRAPNVLAGPSVPGRPQGTGGGELDASVARAIRQARWAGRPVPDAVRGRMEQVLGADFSGVRVHVDARSDHLNDALRSRAFTVGADVFVRRSEYRPGSPGGDALLAHELTHTVQQGAVSTGSTATGGVLVQRQIMDPAYEDEVLEIEQAKRAARASEVRTLAPDPARSKMLIEHFQGTGRARTAGTAQPTVGKLGADPARASMLTEHLQGTGRAPVAGTPQLTGLPPAEGLKRRPRLTRLVERRGRRGVLDRPDVELTKGRKERRAADARQAQRRDEAERDRAAFLEQREADYYFGQCTSLHQEIEAAHPKLQEGLAAKIRSGAADAAKQATAIGATPARLDELKGLAADVAALRPDWNNHVAGVLYKAESKVTGPYNLMKAELSTLVTYNMPALRTAKTDVEHIIATKNWLDPGDAVDRLKAEYNVVRPLHLQVEGVKNRIAYLKTNVADGAKPAIETAETTVGTATTKTQPELEKLLKDLDATLLPHQQVVAADKFQTSAGDDPAINDALEDLLDHHVIRRGIFNKKYRTSWDTKDGYSVEYTVVGLQNIVIHAHCHSNGSPKIGTSNAVHWKLKTQKFSPGASHPISDKLARALVDPETHKSKSITQG